jgi:hypothetical protein
MAYTHMLTKQPVPNQPGWVTLSGPCRVTGRTHTTPPLLEFAIECYERGFLAQDAFPDLAGPEREFLISGTSPEGWRAVFGGGDHE